MMIWELALLIVIVAICAYLIINRICLCSERNHKADITGDFLKDLADKVADSNG